MRYGQKLFRYSPWDSLLATSGIAIFALIVWTSVCFKSLSWWVLGPAWVVIAWSYCWNLQCISHNFIHNPFFAGNWLNRGFSILEALNLGVPQILYHHYHMNHHWGDSDRKGPDGSTRDWSSIYRYGKGDQPESFLRYCLLSFWRVEVAGVIRVVFRHGWGQVLLLAVETLALAAFWDFMLWLDWRYFFCYYLTSYYCGWMLSYAEGYLEHYRCEPDNPFANSVSSYHWVYNVLWFNNGYHQEHHWDPKRHWTRMHALHAQIRPKLLANGTRMLRGPHLTTFFEDWIAERRMLALETTSTQEARAA
jgi:fatty acid desaturase